MNDSLDQCCVLKERAEKKETREKWKEQAKSKLTFGFCSSMQTAGHTVKVRERERNCWLEADSHMDCHALY